MFNKEECLAVIAKHRTDEVVVATMGVTVPWGQISDHPLDYASVGSAMGHAADFGLGIALARQDKKVLVLNGDGSMLMCLGTLATVTALQKPAHNFYLFVCENGSYEVTGNQPTPGGQNFSFTTIARGAGFEKFYEFEDAASLDESLPSILAEAGPTLINLKIALASEPPPSRSADHAVRFLRPTLAGSTHELRQSLETQ